MNGGRATVLLVAAVLLAGSAQAGLSTLNRGDLSDEGINWIETGKKGTYSKIYHRAGSDRYFYDFDASTFTTDKALFTASGLRTVSNADGFGAFLWKLYEPDTIQRTGGANVKMSQGDYLAIGIFASTSGTSFSYGGYTSTVYTATQYTFTTTYPTFTSPVTVEGCKGSFQGVAKGGGNFATKGSWNVQCSKSALNDLGLDSGQKSVLKDIFGFKNSIKIKGKR